MKRLLPLLIFVAASGAATAQCTPNPLYADSLFGIWPDTTTNFAPAILGEFYTDTLNLIVPTDAGVVDPNFSGFNLDSIQVNDVSGLPPGLSYNCASQTPAPCSYLTGQLGCALIEGVPTELGIFPIVIEVTAFSALFGQIVSVDQDFTGYSIQVGSLGTGELSVKLLGGVKNVPNPFSQRTHIEFALARAATAKVRVFNLLGEELWSDEVRAKAGVNRVPFDGGALQAGVYLYKVEAGREAFTGRMVLSR
jgi:hypothetical protein